MPKVSIVIPTYNRPQLLKRAIESVLKLPYKDYEIIVVQNGGRSDARPVVQAFHAQGVPLVCLYRQKGDPNYARNVGIAHAAGEYIAFMDDDDEWLPGKLTDQVAMLDHDPRLAMAASDAIVMNAKREVVKVTEGRLLECSYANLIRQGNFIWSLSLVMVRKACLDDVGCLNERFRVASDYDLYLRLAEKYPFAFIREPRVHYHVHGLNLSSESENTWTERADIALRIRKDGVEFRAAVRENLADVAQRLYRIALQYCLQKDFKRAGYCLKHALRYDALVGLKFSWGRFPTPLYSLIRPYLLFLYCKLRGLGRKVRVA